MFKHITATSVLHPPTINPKNAKAEPHNAIHVINEFK
jgi:hypothetical protein